MIQNFYTCKDCLKNDQTDSKFRLNRFNRIVVLQSRTELLENVFLLMGTTLHDKTVSKSMALHNENPSPSSTSYKCPGMRLYFKDTTTLLPGGGGERRITMATMFRNIFSKYELKCYQEFSPRL